MIKMNTNYKKTIKEIKEFLNNKKVTGYIWMTENENPSICNNKEINFKNLCKDNTYNKIQEAYLYDGENSIHIKNIDGTEHCYMLNENNFTNNNYKIGDKFSLPSHKKIPGELLFKQVYEKTPSISGGDYVTWQPVARLFKGFSKQQKDN